MAKQLRAAEPRGVEAVGGGRLAALGSWLSSLWQEAAALVYNSETHEITWPGILLLGAIAAVVSRSIYYRRTAKVCYIQVLAAGKTGDCERKFLQDVSKLLSRQAVYLKEEKFTPTSRNLLLVFCPIASRMGTDIGNALVRLSDQQKAILVVMHLIPKDNTGAFLDTRQQRIHPAVVQTVHTRFSVQDGFYPCEMNEVAMADVADAIKALA